MSYDVGDLADVRFNLKDEAGNPVDATQVTLKIKAPDGTVTTHVFPGDAAITHEGTGVYSANISLTAAGFWSYRWEALNPQAAEENTLSVDVGAFGAQAVYATVEQVQAALRPEGDTKGGTAADLAPDQIKDAVIEATNEIDAMVPGAPFTAVPRIVTSMARDIGAYLATLTFRKGNPLPQDHPVRLRYDRAESLLQKAAKGQLDLTDNPEPHSGEPTVINMYEGDLFTLEGLGLGIANRLPPWNGGCGPSG